MRRPFRLGLTGSIGMGKSTTAAMFADAGVPVWDADTAVHRLYARGGAAFDVLAAQFPDATGPDGIDRARLRAQVATDPDALTRIEAVVHPLVAAARAEFLARSEAAGIPLVVLDIPLLYETGAEAQLDAVLVVTAPPEVQRARVLTRPGMTPEVFARILARQMSDSEKRARADFTIETTGLEPTRAAVASLIHRLTRPEE